MELYMKIAVLVVLCVSVAQGRSGDPGGDSNARRELLLKALADLQAGRSYGNMEEARNPGPPPSPLMKNDPKNARRELLLKALADLQAGRSYGNMEEARAAPPPDALMKRYPAGPQSLDKIDRSYYPGNPSSLRDLTDDLEPGTVEDEDTVEVEDEEKEKIKQEIGEVEGIVSKAIDALTSINEDLNDIKSMAEEGVKEACGEQFEDDQGLEGGAVPDSVPDRRQSEDDIGSELEQLSDTAKETIAEIADLLNEVGKCSTDNGDGDETVATTEAPPIEATTVDTEPPTEPPSDETEEVLERDLLKKLLKERISELSKRRYYGK
ncbi:uncharacterized protein LOC123541171 [Mercenaria mercenaria]|uniref:uncharacterized protein LOC123541171 n=1 Tax=Mercenaria mercenaria TaxID=6596 RepID=UPI00234E7EEE|nr:uncharacterized protein LOC123541171 [Mercenaria mercenaria]